MRLKERRLNVDVLRQAVSTLEMVEEYPHDKYLPSFLFRGEVPEFSFHVLIAADLEGDNIRVVTMYVPDPEQIVFVHGCFWHGRSCRAGRNRPGSNREYWDAELERSMQRDRMASA
jgi:G:T-mismatch repair DNA endonuclease (very short patch repair protein)